MSNMGVQDPQDIARGQEGPGSQAKQPDATILHPPMNPAHQGIQQIVDCFRFGTPFLKQLILQEADVIYECRICRSLFRGLLNFVEHKKSFCVERVCMGNRQTGKGQTADSREYGISPEEAARILAWGAPVPEQDVRKNTESLSTMTKEGGTPKQTNELYDSEEKFVMLRPIPTTSRAVEQQVVQPDHILHEEKINKLSSFKSLRDQGEDTSKIVGEITIRQAAKAGRVVAPTSVDKRDTLHSLLKTVNSHFYLEKTTSPTSDTSTKKDTLRVEVDAPKSSVSPTISRSVSPRAPQADKKTSSVSPRQKKAVTAVRPSAQQLSTRNTCTVCKKKCKNWTALAWHMRIHTKPLFKCPLCQYRSPSVYNVRRHIQAMHNLSSERVDELLSRNIEEKATEDSADSKGAQNNNESNSSPTCDICFKTFANRRNVARHKVIHEREKLQAEGKYTPASNATQEEIARGKVMQTMDEKNMRCRRCHKQLSTIRRLQQHCCNHFGYNRYRCRMCPYENNDYTQMRRHMMGKHGRQFRTIQQISEAIKSMKVGVWINLMQSQNSDDADSKKAIASTSKSSKTEEKNPKQGASTVKAGTNKQGTSVSKQSGSGGKVGTSSTEKVSSRGADDGKTNVSPSPVRAKADADAKKVPESPSKDIPSTSSASSPGSSRRSLIDTVAPGKERETPMRQARLNHRSVSPKGPQEKEEEEDKALLQMMMDKKNMKCLKCKKRFQYHSSLLRHTRIHLLEESSSSEQGGTKKNRESASKKAQAIKSLINQSQLRCLKCRKRFTSMSTLKQHVGRHLGYNTFRCRYCGYVSHNYSWFKNHLIIKHSNHVANISDLGQLIGSMKTK